MIFVIKIILFSILFNNQIFAESTNPSIESKSGVCVLRRTCDDSSCDGKSLPIILEKSADNIRSLSLLSAMCPQFLTTDKPRICCNELQLESIYIIIYNYAHLGLNRCPSCLKNLEKLFCELNCSPKQNEFIKVRKVHTNKGEFLVSKIDYYISETFANGIFDSCKDVRHNNGKVLDMMCAESNSKDCTPLEWLNYIGNNIEEKLYSPYKINFILSNATLISDAHDLYTPKNESYYKCSDSPNKEEKSCSCEDCPEVCNKETKNAYSVKNKVKKSEKMREKRDSGHCLMRGVCDESAFGAIPCVSNELPQPITEAEAIEELKEMCPHLSADSVCCTDEQIIRLNQTFEMISIFLNECPTCVRNFENIFCHLWCSPDQQSFMRITQTKPNEDGKDMVSEVEYFANDDWAKGVYDSCSGVHRLGFNVLDHYCKPYKAQNCDHQKFLQFIGSDSQHFGHSPFEINFIFSNEDTVTSDGMQFRPAKQSFLKCSQKPHTGENACHCLDCDASCSPDQLKAKTIPKQLPKYAPRTKRQENSCVMTGICGESAFGAIPCSQSSPSSAITNAEALEELREMCPHLSSESVCCTDDQIIRLNQTFEMLSMFLKECPSCVRNFEKVICHMSCSTDQHKFLQITKTERNDNGNDMVSEVNYYVNDDWIKGVFDSCKGVHRLGFNVLDHYCKPYKGSDCDHDKFMQFIGADAKHYGHSPFEINFIFTNQLSISSDGVEYSAAKESYYKCSDNPHTNEGKCSCNDCSESCAPGEQPTQVKQLPKYAPRNKRHHSDSVFKREINEREIYDESLLPTKITNSQRSQDEQYCLIDSVCSHTYRRSKVSCLKIREPKAITDSKAIDVLKHICPELVESEYPMTCCDSQHIYQLEQTFRLSAKQGLAICESCQHNFRTTLCQLTCSPRQNQFVRIMNTTQLSDITIIDGIEYYMDVTFAEELFNSCKDIDNGTVLNTMCGKWGNTRECSPQRWLESMGRSTDNVGHVPFQMTVQLTEANTVVNEQMFYPMNETAYSCSESPTTQTTACGCNHCEDACV